MNYLDTSVLVAALLEKHPEHERCSPLLTRDSITSARDLAEAFTTLTVAFGIRNFVAAEALSDLPERIRVEPISLADYLALLGSAKGRGLFGGIVYGAIHGEVARRLKVKKIYTHNLSNFKHVAPELNIARP